MLDELEAEGDRLEERFEAERERRCEAVRDKQDAEAAFRDFFTHGSIGSKPAGRW